MKEQNIWKCFRGSRYFICSDVSIGWGLFPLNLVFFAKRLLWSTRDVKIWSFFCNNTKFHTPICRPTPPPPPKKKDFFSDISNTWQRKFRFLVIVRDRSASGGGRKSLTWHYFEKLQDGSKPSHSLLACGYPGPEKSVQHRKTRHEQPLLDWQKYSNLNFIKIKDALSTNIIPAKSQRQNRAN